MKSRVEMEQARKADLESKGVMYYEQSDAEGARIVDMFLHSRSFKRSFYYAMDCKNTSSVGDPKYGVYVGDMKMFYRMFKDSEEMLFEQPDFEWRE